MPEFTRHLQMSRHPGSGLEVRGSAGEESTGKGKEICMRCKTSTGAGPLGPRSFYPRSYSWSGFFESFTSCWAESLGAGAGFALIVGFSLMAVLAGWAWSL